LPILIAINMLCRREKLQYILDVDLIFRITLQHFTLLVVWMLKTNYVIAVNFEGGDSFKLCFYEYFCNVNVFVA